ncbi:MATE family efflux transporter [Ornithinibacillus halophilus]|uniref:DUF4190 domain-containing protein n=1 Tax=Ornithinibacillus halophilus TaxID=930117 RepID=A0A1M5D3K0_9BACI|nr:DUF4190 domain-containing protein [Ornithinibacillus halophilus]SHF61460.1 hypothetical protein SAMN05216225_1001508 [Ornithinibacillus halophilus]
MDDYNRKDDVEDAPNHGGTLDEDIEPNAPKNFDSPGYIATYSNRDEETAAELTADDYRGERVSTDDDVGAQANTAVGWIALALSIASFFWLPIILGGAGIIVGFVARNRDAETLGNIAIAAGVISILITLFIVPFV